MNPLLDEMRRSRSYERVLADLRASGRTGAENLWGASAALLVAALGEDLGATGLCILPGVEDAERFAEDVRFFAPERLAYFPAWEGLDADDPPDLDIACERLILVRQLLDPSADPAGGARIIVAPVAAVLQHTATRAELDRHTLRLCTGEEHGPERIAVWLVDQGFRRVHQVEVPGEFCRRGGILDVYPFGAVLPYRIEFFGDVIESIRTFDPAEQTSRQVVERCEVLSAAGAAGTSQTGGHTLLDSLPERAWVALKEPAEVAARADAPETRLETAGAGARRLMAACERLALVRVSAMPLDGRAHDFETRSVSRFTGQLQAALDELGALARRCRRTVVLCNNDAEKQRLSELLADSPLPGDRLEMRLGRVSAGFESPPMGLALIPHHELFHRYQQRRTPPRYRHMTLVESVAELEPGDYVVHAQHGIGVYRGLKLLGPPRRRGPSADVPVRQECLCIEYRDGAILYVPVSHIELVQKYAGPSGRRPELSRLGGKGWSRQRERAAQAAEKLALEMLSLHAERLTHRGIAFEDDPEWQREFEAAFIYEETEDQLRVAEEVRRDMTSEQPMDRLICGDVGYGKTEIAMRAAFRAASNNTQVAVLVPTTVLAAQHHRTFCERMADYPLRIELLCRFRTRAEQKRILEGLADGTVDIVIGTHRLIQEDVRFRRLGLVIIDEEQRFGVAHKERLKRFHATVDVLTLTATPIPRTLHMSLLGLKDISNLETPPRDRLAIQTRLMRFEPEKIRRIILRELARDGQVFFVHNRVLNIEAVARRLRRIVPEARIIVAHGQMPERQLEAHMRRFVDHEADVLVPSSSTAPTTTAWPTCTSCAAASAATATAPTPTSCCPRSVPSPPSPRNASRPSRSIPNSARDSRSPCATSSCAARATSSAPNRAAISQRWATTCTAASSNTPSADASAGPSPRCSRSPSPSAWRPTCPRPTCPTRATGSRPTAASAAPPPRRRSAASRPSGRTASGACPPPRAPCWTRPACASGPGSAAFGASTPKTTASSSSPPTRTARARPCAAPPSGSWPSTTAPCS